VVFAIEHAERDRLEAAHLLEALGRAINLCVLRTPPVTGTIDQSVRSLARELAANDKSPLAGGQVVDGAVVAARGQPLTTYPGGAPSLMSCVGR
jgi:hypothetical protein